MSLLNCLGGEYCNTFCLIPFVYSIVLGLKIEPYVDHYYRDYPTLVRTTDKCAIDQGKCSAVKDFLNGMLTFAFIFFLVNSRGYISYCSLLNQG